MPRVLSISSHVVAGRVGHSISSFAFERLGHEVWALPSVVSLQPSAGVMRGAVVAQDSFDAIIDGLLEAGLSSLAGLHIGYLRTPEQVRAALRVVAALRMAAPAAAILLDPVLGDMPGGLYIPAETAAAIGAELVPRADILTPNLFELGFLAGRALSTQAEALAALRALPAGMSLCTSAPASAPGRIATLLVDGARAWRIETERFPQVPHGTGDLLAALFLARRISGEPPDAAFHASVSCVAAMIASAVRLGLDVLPTIEEQAWLAAPARDVVIERLA